MDELAATVRELAARVETLELENRALRDAAVEGTDPPGPQPFSRRNLLRIGGVGAAAAAGAALMRPMPAGATANPVLLDTPNDGGATATTLTSTAATETLGIVNTATGKAIDVSVTSASNTVAGLSVTHAGDGEAITAHSTKAAGTASVIHAIQDGTTDAIVGEVSTPGGGAGVVGLGIDNAGVVGVTGGGGAGVVGIIGTGATGPAVFAWGYDANATVAALEAEHDGKGNGVFAHIENAASTHHAVLAMTKGSGQAVNAQTSGTGVSMSAYISNAASAAGAMWAKTLGSGPGIDVNSVKGVGGKFTGKTAQVYLVPSTATTHPTSGAMGQLFVDKTGRLWFCKGGTNWKQLA